MTQKEARVGLVCRSTQNCFDIHYKIVKKLKTVCWVKIVKGDHIYKGIRYHILKKIGV